MLRFILCCLLLPFPGYVFSDQFIYDEIIKEIINGKVVKCRGEPMWEITLPLNNDHWMAGRLDALAQAGFTRQGGGSPIWLLTPADAPDVQIASDDCMGRMLIHP